MSIIFKRRSIRKYKNSDISGEQMKLLLKAAMSAPTARNSQEWEFVVIRKRESLNAILKVHPFSKALETASAAILVCGKVNGEPANSYFQQNCAAAIQNILLCATEMGLGSLWMGVYPNPDRTEKLSELFKLPGNIIPLGLVAVGEADEEKHEEDRYDENKVHYEVY